MNSKPLNLFQLVLINLVVSCGYFIFGFIGTFLDIPPSSASPIWPPTGLALASALVYGISACPGIFVGALAIKLYIFIGFSTPESIAPTLITASISSLGAAAQALFGVYLIRRFVGIDDPLIEDSKIIRFFFFGAIVSSIISPSIGIATIFYQGFITIEDIALSWITWWAGDCIGIIVFAPIILSFIAHPKKLWKIRRKTVTFPLLGMFFFVVLLFQYFQQLESARIALIFERQVTKFHSVFNNSLLEYVEINLIIKGLFDSSHFVSKEEFAAFTRPILEKNSNIQALELISYIPLAQRKQFESSETGYFKIREPDQDNKMVSATDRAVYFPITYLEPLKKNQRALGFDVSTNPTAFKALSIAIQTGQTTITEPIQLIQDLEKKKGFVLYSPVYQKNDNAQKQKRLKGFIAVVFRMEDEIKDVLSDFSDVQLFIKINDQDYQLYSNFPDSKSANLNLLSLQKIRQIQLANRTWTVTYHPSDNFYHQQVSWTIWWLFFGGVVITGLTGIGLLMLIGRTLRTENLVHARTQDLAKSEERWQFALEGSRDGVWDWDIETNKVFFSTRCKEMLGYSDNEISDDLSEWNQLIHSDDKERVFKDLNNHFEQRTSVYENEHRLLCKDGSYKWILDRGKVVAWTEENQPMRMIGTHMDITSRKLAEDQLQLFSRVFNETNEGIIITDAASIIIDVNPAFCDITGFSRKEAIGNRPNILNSGQHSKEFYADMWKILIETGHWHGDLWNRKKNGSLYAELLTISSILDEKGKVLHYVGLFSDITNSKQQQEALQLMAHYDILTKLPNRVLLADRFTQAIAHCKRRKNILAICFLDLDDFKPVNDMYGHEAGDQLLIEVAIRIKSSIRDEDTVSRHGGDEFILLLGDIETFPECEQMLKRLISSLSKPYLINNQSISISASIGVSLYPDDNANPDTLIRHADQAMYQAKLAGRNCYHLFNAELDQQTIQKNTQLGEIEQALSKQEFCLYYQPKVNMDTGEIFGTEALIRWLHPEKGLIPPIQFLPILEGTALEIELGNWVIDEALKQLNQWKKQKLELEVSVNISSYHLQQTSFVSDLEQTLSKYPKVKSEFLQLEILESSALGDLHAISAIINTCRHALGLTIALDDFGTGYSSLTHLRNLAAKTIKIDQSFVRDMQEDPDDYAIVEGIIGLATSFNREVVAEGVETSEAGLLLLSMGCYKAQGYAIAKPMPANEFFDWLTYYKPNKMWLGMNNKTSHPSN